MKISFIGLGHMGAPMARNPIKAGHALSVFDTVEANVDALTAAGAVAAPSPQACAGFGAKDFSAVINMYRKTQ